MLHKGSIANSTAYLPDAVAAAQNFAQWTVQWHAMEAPAESALSRPEDTVQALHRANFTLWHLEDRARDPAATDTVIAGVKRSIDTANQQRNDLVERFDRDLLQQFADAALPNVAAPLHSETPGMMVDRLSILSLKLFHTAEEAERSDATATHRERNQQRFAVLQQQSADLQHCLADLLQAVTQGTRGYRLYRQMKMYNDPELNPVLYTSSDRGRNASDG